jgi:ABC-type multidrug transport system fused ATPase/permease subunit
MLVLTLLWAVAIMSTVAAPRSLVRLPRRAPSFRVPWIVLPTTLVLLPLAYWMAVSNATLGGRLTGYWIGFVGLLLVQTAFVWEIGLKRWLYVDQVAADDGAAGAREELDAKVMGKTSGWFSFLVFGWLNPVLATARRGPLDMRHMFQSAPEEDPGTLYEAFAAARASGRGVIGSVMYQERKPLLVSALLKLIHDCIQFAQPLLLKHFIDSVGDPAVPLSTCIATAVALFTASLFQVLFIERYFWLVYRIGARARAAVNAAVYRKALRIQVADSGSVLNHMSVDAEAFYTVMPYFHVIWSAPMQIGVCLYLLFNVLGVATLGGLAVMLLFFPSNTYVMRRYGALRKQMLGAQDTRVRYTSDALNGIRLAKSFAWESAFLEKIGDSRATELRFMRQGRYLRSIMEIGFSILPTAVALASFSWYAGSDNTLTPGIAFTALNLFNLIRFPLQMFPNNLNGVITTAVSGKRIQAFLDVPEVPSATMRSANTSSSFSSSSSSSASSAVAIRISRGSYRWSDDAANVLHNIDFFVARKSLVAVVGEVGAGKSSLLHAILSEMIGPRPEVAGSIAYTAQNPWILNASVRDNIMLAPSASGNYDLAVQCTELYRDLTLLSDGDRTMIGERGINLSGGQKARVALARLVYANADICLLDDPLSAVDVHVGRAIFANCIRGALRNSSRVLATHQLQFLNMCDQVYLLEGGSVLETGTSAELQSGRLGELVRAHDVIMHQHEEEAADGPAHSADGTDSAAASDKKAVGGTDDAAALHTTEGRGSGTLGLRMLLVYARSMGSTPVVSLLMLAVLAEVMTQVASSFWLSHWSSDTSASSSSHHLPMYALLCGVALVVCVARVLGAIPAFLHASKFWHHEMLVRLLRAPVSFFDVTPTGRILNRFTKDTDMVDVNLPASTMWVVKGSLDVLSVFVVISVASPVFLCFVVPVIFAYECVRVYYLPSSREAQRLGSISKSPVFAHFQETLQGLSTLRAYGLTDSFAKRNLKLVDDNQRPLLINAALNRWLSIRLQSLGAGLVLASGVLASVSRDQISAGLAALSVTYALKVTGSINWLIRQSAENETHLVALERLREYTSLAGDQCQVPQEAAAEVPEAAPPASWPSAGAVSFENVVMRYRPGLPDVLRNLTFSVAPGTRVGIVGRTGAGKSSLSVALLRIVELASGRITIDGVDVGKIGLTDLRTAISIIPQDPTLFVGTVRYNMDPFGRASDKDMWAALATAQMDSVIRAMEGGLDAAVKEGGSNFSVGQRQLLALARALLRQKRILVLDEATANIDVATDAVIQKAVRTAFPGVTVLTVAHRIGTILDYDQILVMDQGQVVEQGPPDELRAISGGIFAGMVDAGGSID